MPGKHDWLQFIGFCILIAALVGLLFFGDAIK